MVVSKVSAFSHVINSGLYVNTFKPWQHFVFHCKDAGLNTVRLVWYLLNIVSVKLRQLPRLLAVLTKIFIQNNKNTYNSKLNTMLKTYTLRLNEN